MKTITAKYRSLCNSCKDVVLVGAEVLYDEDAKKVYHLHLDCQPAEQGDFLGKSEAGELADRLGFE